MVSDGALALLLLLVADTAAEIVSDWSQSGGDARQMECLSDTSGDLQRSRAPSRRTPSLTLNFELLKFVIFIERTKSRQIFVRHLLLQLLRCTTAGSRCCLLVLARVCHAC